MADTTDSVEQDVQALRLRRDGKSFSEKRQRAIKGLRQRLLRD